MEPTEREQPMPRGKVVLFYPEARRYSANFSTHRLPLLATAHAGLPLLGEILRLRGHEVEIYDEQLTPFHPAMLRGAELAGVSIQTRWARQGYRIAAAARAAGIPVVLGGAHATLLPEEGIDHADYVVRHEGERTLVELCEALEVARRGGLSRPDEAALATIGGLSYRDVDGRAHHNAPRPRLTEAELDALPFPNWSLIRGFGAPWASPLSRVVYFVVATRGCTFACDFCSVARTFGPYRHRSAAGIIAELRAHFDPDRQFLFFLDDSLCCDTDFVKELLTRLKDERLVPRLGWHSQMRCDVAKDPELVRLMHETNCFFATFGFESINPSSLKQYKKGQTVEDIRRCIATMNTAGVLVNGFFVLGGENDDEATIAATLRFAVESGCVIAGFMPLTPFPGTPLYDRMEAEGRIFTKDWELYDVQHVVFRPRRMTPLALYQGTLDAYRAFYSVWNDLRKLPLAARKARSLFHALAGGTWPLLKQFGYIAERAANRDYLRLLETVSARGVPAGRAEEVLAEPPELLQDVLTGRAQKGLVSAGLALLDRGRGVLRRARSSIDGWAR